MPNQKLKIEDIVARFDRPITLSEHGCWLWLGHTDKRGYARFSGSLVHAMTWRMAGFECIGNVELCHTCPSHNCINPDHLYVGTHKQNMNDDNRQQMGPVGRLTQQQISELSNLLRLGAYTKSHIARMFGVSPQWITKFERGEFKYAIPQQSPVQ